MQKKIARENAAKGIAGDGPVHDAVAFASGIAQKKSTDWEVFASYNKVGTVRFARNRLLESKTFGDFGIGIRIIVNGSTGFSSTSGFGKTEIEKAADAAQSAANAKAPDGDYHGLPQPLGQTRLEKPFDPLIRDLGAEEMTQIGASSLEIAKSIGGKLDVSGSTTFVYEKAVIKNSAGVDCTDESSFAYGSVTAEDRRGPHENSGIGWSIARFLSDFRPEKAGREAVENASVKLKDAKISAGEYDVVFGNYAVTDLAEHILSYAISLPSLDAGITYFWGKLGKKVAAEDFSLVDDGTLEGSLAAKQNDDEGTPTQRTPIIEGGTLTNLISDDYYAKKMSRKLKKYFESTGNAFRFEAVPGRRYDSLPSACPTNLIVAPGRMDDGEILSGIRKGIFVGRTWYTYPVNQTVGDFTCTNRSNTFLIENGEITAALPANSFRINDNLPRLLQRIEGIGKETKAVTVWGGSSAVYAPQVRMSKVRVVYSKEAAMGGGG